MTLLCPTTGHPEPRIRWSKYGGMLPSSSLQLADGSLSIVGVGVEDEGTYLCHAENGVGAAENILDVALEVLGKSVSEGHTRAVSCILHLIAVLARFFPHVLLRCRHS